MADRLVGLEESVAQEGRLTILRGPTSYSRRPAELVNPEVAAPRVRALYGENPPGEIPPEGVAELGEVTVYGPGILERGDHVIAESVETPARFQPRGAGPAPRRLSRAVSVAKLGSANYGHFLVEQLPRIALNAEALPGDAPLLLHDRSRPFAAPVCELAGIDPARIEWLDDRPVTVETLHWPTRNTFAPLRISPHSVAYLRDVAERVAHDPDAGRRLFVGRRDAKTRELVNEDEVFAALEPLGFERVYPGFLPFAEQVRTFAEASTVVAVMGAALTNMVFMPPGRIVMLQPATSGGYLFWDLAHHGGHDLAVMWGPVDGDGRGEAPPGDPRPHRFRKHATFRVDVPRLLEVVENA